MKKFIAIALLFASLIASAEELKKLVLNVKGTISKETPIFVEPISNDRLQITDQFKNSLSANGFKVVQERKDANHIVILKYEHRSDMVCGGRVIKSLDGNIIDGKNNAASVATFTWSQNSMQGKCASDILSGIAEKLSSVAK